VWHNQRCQKRLTTATPLASLLRKLAIAFSASKLLTIETPEWVEYLSHHGNPILMCVGQQVNLKDRLNVFRSFRQTPSVVKL